MQDAADMELLRQYAEHDSEDAFTTLVTRHVNLVYSTALRHIGHSHPAEEITQAVFVILARKARSLSKGTVLSGWLYHASRLTVANFLRSETQRTRREQEAYMQSTLNETETDAWMQISPLLDTAMAGLNERDRDAIVLRFFEGRNMREVGSAIGASEEAAKKRVNRAVEKLRKFFTRRGITLSAAAIAGAVAANSVHAAPVGLTISAVTAAKRSAVTGSTLTLIKGALKVMAWTKVKTGIVVGVGVLLAAGTATVTINKIRHPNFNPEDFRATAYPTGSADMMQYMTNSYGHPLNYSFPISPIQGCSINGLLNQCMEVSGWRYLIDKQVAAGSVKFGCSKVLNGEEWVAAFENALQTGTPEWWDAKKKGFRRENLVLIRYPEQKTALVLPKDQATKYQ